MVILFCLCYLKVLRITGGASGGKRARVEKQFDFSVKQNDPELVKEALQTPPYDLESFSMALQKVEFEELYCFALEQKSMERVCDKIICQIQLLKSINDRKQ